MGFFPNGQPYPSKQEEEPGPSVDVLAEQVEMMSDELQRETQNNKVLEGKCEEYLGQLQRSAEIIEEMRASHENNIAGLEDKVREIQSVLRETHERLLNSEEETRKVLADNQQLLDIIKQQADQIARNREGAIDKDRNVQDMTKKLR